MKSSIVVGLILMASAFGWWKGYIQPKDTTLEAASTCLAQKGGNRAYWGTCLKQAEKLHGSRMLVALGY